MPIGRYVDEDRKVISARKTYERGENRTDKTLLGAVAKAIQPAIGSSPIRGQPRAAMDKHVSGSLDGGHVHIETQEKLAWEFITTLCEGKAVTISAADERRLWELKGVIAQSQEAMLRARTREGKELQKSAIAKAREMIKAVWAPYFAAAGWNGKGLG